MYVTEAAALARRAAVVARSAGDDVPSPCVSVCRMDADRVFCIGCLRTIPEITEWSRADADFVKARTGYSIGGVSPVGHLQPPVTLIDRELFRFDEIWAAAGHPHAVVQLTPQDLERLTGAPVADVV